MKTEMPDPPSRNYHLEIADERDRLRAEVERLREALTSIASVKAMADEASAALAETEKKDG